MTILAGNPYYIRYFLTYYQPKEIHNINPKKHILFQEMPAGHIQDIYSTGNSCQTGYFLCQ